MTIFRVATTTIAFLAKAKGLYNEEMPLLGYTCKQNAQSPCELCPPGYYCIAKDRKPIQCGSSPVFCPLGSFRPKLADEGWYTTGGDVKTRTGQEICEPGFVCTGGEKDKCPAGYYCSTPGTTVPTPCRHHSAYSYCPLGSITPQLVDEGHLVDTRRTQQKRAPVGYYASNGDLHKCPGGHYGATEGLSHENCSGLCGAGWYCPPGSISEMQNACGDEEFFCPEGSETPQQVQPGHYTSTIDEPCRQGTYRGETPNIPITLSFVPFSREKGPCVPCPDNTYKVKNGDDISLCLKCGPKARSVGDRTTCECYQSATERLSKRLYFDTKTRTCIDITGKRPPPDNMYPPESQYTKSKQHSCMPGHFCRAGTMYKCPRGRYGDEHHETNIECSGPCKEGYWCREGSTSPTQNKCGGSNVFCPAGSEFPIYVRGGYYTDENEPHDMKTSQHLCPPGHYCPGDGFRHPCPEGRYGAESGLYNDYCNGLCEEGYYCNQGSISLRQNPCGSSKFYCPEGSGRAKLVDEGYYTLSSKDIMTEISISPAGPNSTHDMQLQCEIGYYCSEGIKYQCPGGTYGWFEGAKDVSDCLPCRSGYYCPSHPGPPSRSQIPCGKSYMYCPSGSSEPLDIEVGYYGIGGEFAETEEGLEAHNFRTGQELCPPGFYCELGMKYPCPAGTYGDSTGLVDPLCGGLCPKGFFCPLTSPNDKLVTGTVHPLPCAPGSYSTGGAPECTSCEVPSIVSMDVKKKMCRDDRSCCFELFE